MNRSSAVGVAGVLVGVQLARQLAVRLGDLLGRRRRRRRRGSRSSPSRTTHVARPCCSAVPLSRRVRTIAGRSVRPFQRVAAAQHLGDDDLAALARLVGDGLGDVRVERLVLQVERLEALLAQLAEHHVEQRPDLVGMAQVRGLGGVEHRQQRLGEPRRGPVGLVADLRCDPLAVVLEVGLRRAGRCPCTGRARRRARRSRRRSSDGQLVLGSVVRGVVLVGRVDASRGGGVVRGLPSRPRRPRRRSARTRRHDALLVLGSSSTISASTISSSSTAPAPFVGLTRTPTCRRRWRRAPPPRTASG